ncbi:polysaccharide deacetylase family protein [Streptomyces sp. NBC_01304]|uniref:polysaccharide deacetylase family protein n=1 Tax=Streptomyces sp. NBC_01304 TaxID=2903818 RepID=UPI002E108BA2|nr:polysaccharide deacetylase family protein [Streptomyces sp. NBC_01304]
MTKHRASRRKTLTAALSAAASLALVLTGCSMETVSPKDARAKPVQQGMAAPDAVNCAKAECIALTFDGGPGPYTAKLLDVLKEKDVPATFFLLGKKHIDRHPDLVRRIADEGHEVANHTWTHPRLTEVDAGQVREELERTQRELVKLTGKEPTLMRPPQGRTDEDVAKICKELGLAQILWSTTAKDYSTNDSGLIKERTLGQADRDGIILLHDIYKGTVAAVPGIIDELKQRGYTFVTVPPLLAPGTAEPGKVYR